MKEKQRLINFHDESKTGKDTRKVSKSENRESLGSDQPYEAKWKKSMSNAFKTLSAKRMGRQDRFKAKNIRRNQIKFYNSNGSFRSKHTKLEESESKSENNRSRHSSISSSASLIIKESSICEVHTFNLKRSSVYSQSIGKDSDFSSITMSNRRSSSTSAHRAFYVSELVKIQDTEMDRTMHVLKEIIRQTEDFKKISDMPTDKRLHYLQQRLGEKKRLKISFSDKEEIERMKIDNQYKVNVRSALGIKNPDDWIFNLNIGNVMHMSPIGFDDLHSSLYLDSIGKRCVYELSKDSLLEKIVLLTVSYF